MLRILNRILLGGLFFALVAQAEKGSDPSDSETDENFRPRAMVDRLEKTNETKTSALGRESSSKSTGLTKSKKNKAGRKALLAKKAGSAAANASQNKSVVLSPTGQLRQEDLQRTQALPNYSSGSQNANNLAPLASALPGLMGSGSGCEGASNEGSSRSCDRVSPDEALIARAKEAIRQKPPCAIPESPRKVVFGFTGLGGDGWMSGMVKGMTGRQPVDYRSYSWHSSSTDELTPAALCAFALATKPYRSGTGQIVYNSISAVGHSFGGAGARKLAVILGKLGVSLDMVSTADAREPSTTLSGNRPNWARPCNVGRWLNFYETASNLRGYSITGTENIRVNCPGTGLAPHMQIVGAATVANETAEALSELSSCRTDYAQAGSGGDYCNGAGLMNFAELPADSGQGVN